MEHLLLREDVAEAALWARSAFDENFPEKRSQGLKR